MHDCGWLDAPDPVYHLDAWPQAPARKPSPPRARKAWIAATVTAKSGVGQDIKPHMLWVSRHDHVRLHTQCSNRLEIGHEDEEGGENRESGKSLAQRDAASNWEIGHYLESVASAEYRAAR